MKVLCPYCGHHQNEAEQCESCRGLFEPLSRTASQIAMGPWYVRNDAKPFLPGFNLAMLRRLIAVGRFTGDAVLRGPTTHQLWTYARHAPGVAHLLGVCHACSAPVGPGATSCTACGAMFTTPDDRDALGLPTTSIAEALAHRLARNGRLCPVCSNEAVDGGRCADCHTVFPPAADASRVTLGPWQLRDFHLPFRTGMSYDALRRLIESGEVTGDSVLRGPTTHQFFSMVRHTPGVSRLVGKCHACGAFVAATAERCDNCKAPLGCDASPDRLGLLFKTEHEAAEAQRRLDAQVAAIQDAEVIKPVPLATPRRAKAEPPPVSAPPPAALAPSPPPMPPAPADATDAYVLAAQAAAASSGEPRSRRAVARSKRSSPVVFIVTGLITLVAFGSIFFVILGDGGPDRAAVVEADDDDPDDGEAPRQEPNTAQLRNFTAYRARYDAIRSLDTSPRFTPLVLAARKQWEQVQALWEAGRIDEAVAMFPALLEAIRAVEVVDEARQRAIALLGDSRKVRAEAEDKDARQITPDQFAAAEATVARGGVAFDAERYDEAATIYRSSLEEYRAAIAQVAAYHEAVALRQKFGETLTRTFTKAQIDAGGGEALTDARSLVAKGDELIKARRFHEALETLQRAHARIADVELAVKRAIGVHYWALNMGHTAADALLRRAAAKPFTPDDRAAFAQAAENLGLDASLAAGLPDDSAPSFADLAKAIVEQPAALIAQRRGSDAELSFQLGIQLRLLEQLLDQPGDLISPQDEAEVRRIVTVIAKQAETASYPPAFFERIETIKKALIIKPKFESIRQTQIAATKLREDLAVFEKAMPIIPMAKR